MSLFIVGGDNLSKIKDKIEYLGFDDIMHISGRRKNVCRKFQLPNKVDLILVLTDYINHNLMQKVKDEARCKDVKLLFAKRSWSSIYQKLKGDYC